MKQPHPRVNIVPGSCGPMREAINVTPTLHRNQAQVLPHASWSSGSRLLLVVVDAGKRVLTNNSRGIGRSRFPRLRSCLSALVLCSLSLLHWCEPMAEGGELADCLHLSMEAHRLCDHNRHPPPPSTSQARGSSARAQYPLQSHVCTPLELNAERIAKKVEGYWLKVIRTKGGKKWAHSNTG
ncbi:unnamed protein product [Boreogadus saida]